MLYFANPCGPKVIRAMRKGRIGIIDQPNQAKGPSVLAARDSPDAYWCADNGAFSDRFNEARWWRFLQDGAYAAGSCHFAALPDVVADAEATLARSLPWADAVRDLGYRVALVAQDGIENLPIPWDDFDVLFLGGSTRFKVGPAAKSVAEQALEHDKVVHMGRVNSLKRIGYANRIGCTSTDGTFLTYGPDVNLPRVLMWLEILNGPGV